MHPDDRQRPARLNVRLDEELRSRVEAAAQASRRSMNAEICHRIKQAFIEQNSNSRKRKAPARTGAARKSCYVVYKRTHLRAQ